MPKSVQRATIVRSLATAAATLAIITVAAAPASAWRSITRGSPAHVDFGATGTAPSRTERRGEPVLGHHRRRHPHRSGRLFMNNVDGLRGRLRIDYYDAARTGSPSGAAPGGLRASASTPSTSSTSRLRRQQRVWGRGVDPDRGRGGGYPHGRVRPGDHLGRSRGAPRVAELVRAHDRLDERTPCQPGGPLSSWPRVMRRVEVPTSR